MITESLSLPVPVGGGAVDTNDEHKLAKKDVLLVTGSRYNIIHFYCLVVEAGFYSDVVVFACRSSDLGSIPGWGR